MASFADFVSNMVWSAVNWTAFVFKLLALALALPFAGLIVFDFFLWIWKAVKGAPDSSREDNSVNAGVSASHPSLSHNQPRKSASTSQLTPGVSRASEPHIPQQRAGFTAESESN
ncbi:hypothetical protein Micbo1qcDRAFT_36120 [Microdochium bolleyi]|uniref:Uncharacterized protein n=1 Tax=Microdochium bolleyi TaxID=196109 RepID=A0A136IMX6_9PEZI|nr:hypothetical protein Micbo1qcDRAFT_36120 [Microdochium bolleyi]